MGEQSLTVSDGYEQKEDDKAGIEEDHIGRRELMEKEDDSGCGNGDKEGEHGLILQLKVFEGIKNN